MVLLAGAWSGAMQAAPVLQHASWATEEGLPQSSVHAILQARNGYLWLATEGGLVRYDGVEFKVFAQGTEPAFASDDVSSLAEDAEGALWVGTADGLLRYAAGRFRRLGEKGGLPTQGVLALAAAKDRSVLVLTEGGLVRVEAEEISRVPGAPAEVRGLEPQADGSVVLLTNGGVLRYRGGLARAEAGSTASVMAGGERGAAQSRDGVVWRWSDRKVQAMGPAGTRSWMAGRELPGSRVQSLFADRQGTAWVGTNRGLVMLRAEGERVTPVPALGANSILCTTEDAEGDFWIGTETSGLHALRPRTFSSVPGLAEEEISAVVEATDGAMWVGTREDGLRRLPPGTPEGGWMRPVENRSLTSPVILAMAPGLHGDVWVGGPDGLNHVDAQGRVQRLTAADGLPDELVRSLLVGRDGTVWAGTRRGLVTIDARGAMHTLTRADGLSGDLIGSMLTGPALPGSARDASALAGRARHEREVWVATLGGLDHLVEGRVVRSYGAGQGLAGRLITGLAQDVTGGSAESSAHEHAGRVWVSTRDAGLFVQQGQGFVPVVGSVLPRELEGILLDREGALWLRLKRGLLRAPAEALARCVEARACGAPVRTLDTADGLPSEEMVASTEPSLWSSAGGDVWIATRKGLALADSAAMPENRVPPPVVVEQVLADGTEVPLDGGEAAISPGHARYTFSYAAMSFVAPSKVRYRSKLEGFDRDWTSPGPRRNVSYTNLPPGRYRFRVQATNNDGVWSEHDGVVAFRILPPFYRQWWFATLLLVGLAALAVLLYRRRLRRLQRRFDEVLGERNRMAREIHDTLAQDFVGVALQLDLLSRLLEGARLPEAAEQLRATRGLVRAGLEEARQSIWNLRANAGQSSLPVRLQAAVRRFGAEGLQAKVKIGGAYRVLPGALEDEVLRIAQEALSNVSRHAGAATVRVDVQYGQHELVLEIADDGRGFVLNASPEESATSLAGGTGHYGLRGMRERAATIGADLLLQSAPGEGTIVKLLVPLGAGKVLA